MRLVLLGPPGCGKGTQAKILCDRNGWEHIGTGDLLREAIRQGTPCGIRAHPYVEAGHLVPDELVNDLIAERFHRADRPSAFVMDGYPRTVAQARAFDALLRQEHLALNAAILFKVPDEEIVYRVTGRWSCPKAGCKATYHTKYNPPRQPTICDYCGTKLVQREDDQVETVRARLVVYHRNTEELIPHYRRQMLLREVEGQGPIEQVYAHVMKALSHKAGPSC